MKYDWTNSRALVWVYSIIKEYAVITIGALAFWWFTIELAWVIAGLRHG